MRAIRLCPTDQEFRWNANMRPKRVEMSLLRVATDEGIEGNCMLWHGGLARVADDLVRARGIVEGRDPHEVEAISYELSERMTAPTEAGSAIDVALWDIIGKRHGEPIYRLLGAARDRIRGSASTIACETLDGYVELARRCRDDGFTAMKIHPHATGDVRVDIEICRAVRATVGDGMDLMLDPVNAYDRRSAQQVGAVLDELGFRWFEGPIVDADVTGLAALARDLTVPIAACENLRGGIRYLPPYLVASSIDNLRAMGDRIGGISALRKCAALCEAFNIRFGPHTFGPTLAAAANLHVVLSTFSTDLMELPYPRGVLDLGMKDTMWIDADGFVDAPTKPGLGFDIDWDAIDDATVGEVEL